MYKFLVVIVILLFQTTNSLAQAAKIPTSIIPAVLGVPLEKDQLTNTIHFTNMDINSNSDSNSTSNGANIKLEPSQTDIFTEDVGSCINSICTVQDQTIQPCFPGQVCVIIGSVIRLVSH